MNDIFQPSAISIARAKWEEDIWTKKGGATCPVCDRMGKVYARRFGVPMARSLIWLYHAAAGGEWIHIPSKGTRYLLRVNQWGHMVKFGVIETMPPAEDSKTKHSGYYRITELGRRLVREEIKIPQYIFTYNDKRIQSRGEIKNISIRESIESGGFDFNEIMQAAAGAT